MKEIKANGWMWTANPRQAISPRGDYALLVRRAAPGEDRLFTVAAVEPDGKGVLCLVFGDSVAALVENRESAGVWVFDPLGTKEIARFEPEGSVWVCGYNDDTLVVTTDGKQGEGSVVRVYRMPR